jgi:hypothetical protein
MNMLFRVTSLIFIYVFTSAICFCQESQIGDGNNEANGLSVTELGGGEVVVPLNTGVVFLLLAGIILGLRRVLRNYAK